MNLLSRRFLFALLTGALAFGFCPAQADDVEVVKEKLFQAKKDYDAQLQKYKNAVTDLLDKKEVDVRKKGDKKLLDQVKAEREAFEKTGESPHIIPNAIRDPLTAARAKVDKAYTAAIKEYVRSNMDDAAGKTEKEQQEFALASALMLGKKTFLTTLKHFDVRTLIGNMNNNLFTNDGTCHPVKETEKPFRIKVNGEYVPHTIYLPPPAKSYSHVSYTLGRKWTSLHADFGIPKMKDAQLDPSSPLTFEVMGDEKSLWKSEPMTKMDQFQTCTINVEKVKTLTLLVHCPESPNYACACWIEPFLVE